MNDPESLMQWIRTGGGTSTDRDCQRISPSLENDIRSEILAMYFDRKEHERDIGYSHGGRSVVRTYHSSFSSSASSKRELPGATGKPASINRAVLYGRLATSTPGKWIGSPKCDGFRALLYLNAATLEAYLCCGENFGLTPIHRPEALFGDRMDSAGNDAGFVVNTRRAKVVLLVGELVWAQKTSKAGSGVEASGATEASTRYRPVFVAHDLAATSLRRGMIYAVPFHERVKALQRIVRSIDGGFYSAFGRSGEANPAGVHVTTKPFWYSGADVPADWWDFLDAFDGKDPRPPPRMDLVCGTASVPTDGIILSLANSTESNDGGGKRRRKNRKQGGGVKQRQQPRSITTLKWKPASMHTTDAIIWVPDLLIAHRKVAPNGGRGSGNFAGWTPPVPFFVRTSVLGGGNVGVVPAGRPLPRGLVPPPSQHQPPRSSSSPCEYLCAPGAVVPRDARSPPPPPGPWMNRAGSGGPRYAGYVYGGSVRLPLEADLPGEAYRQGIPIWSGMCVEVGYDTRVTAGWVFRKLRLDRQTPNTHMSLLSSIIASAENIEAVEVLGAVFGERPVSNGTASQQPYDPEQSAVGFAGGAITPPTQCRTPEYVPASPEYFPTSPQYHPGSASPGSLPASPSTPVISGAPSRERPENEFDEANVCHKPVYVTGVQPKVARPDAATTSRGLDVGDNNSVSSVSSPSSISHSMLDQLLLAKPDTPQDAVRGTVAQALPSMARAPLPPPSGLSTKPSQKRVAPRVKDTLQPLPKRRCSARIRAMRQKANVV